MCVCERERERESIHFSNKEKIKKKSIHNCFYIIFAEEFSIHNDLCEINYPLKI